MNWKSVFNKCMRGEYKIKFGYAWSYSKRKKKRIGDFGVCYHEDKVILINLHKNNPPARNFLHERIHEHFPLMAHAEVYRWEKEVWDNLSMRQKHRIYKRLFS